MKYRSAEHELPLQALSFNHRAEAFYRANVDHPESLFVQSVKDKGLTRVPVLHHGTSERVLSRLVKVMNAFHEGSGDSMLDYLDEALELEASWKCYSSINRITTHNPRYLSLQQTYVLQMAVLWQQYSAISRIKKNSKQTTLPLQQLRQLRLSH